MYIFELIFQAFKNKKSIKNSYNPLETNSEDASEDNCEHLFLPIDSTNTIFACKHCGIIVPKKKF